MINNNIVETIQTNLGYQPLHKADPNTKEVKDAGKMNTEEKLPQAAIPAVLAAVLNFSHDKNAVTILNGNGNEDWLGTIYCGKEKEAIRKVANYAQVPDEIAERHMENIADETIKIIHENVKDNNTEKLRVFMNNQRHNILTHLPAAMKMGELLNEDTLDDPTNKMEGPVSTFMNKIEDIL